MVLSDRRGNYQISTEKYFELPKGREGTVGNMRVIKSEGGDAQEAENSLGYFERE